MASSPVRSTPPPPPTARPARQPWGTLSRERIVEAALEVLRTEGLDALTIRGLASRLQVAPMTIYGHVKDKDDLLDELVDRLVDDAWDPASDRNEAGTWLRACADRLRRLLVAQPAALHVFLHRPAVFPAALRRMDAIVEVLTAWGASPGDARRAYASLQTYTVGFAALQASRAGWVPTGNDEHDVAHELALMTSDDQFAAGLGYLLEGIRRHTDAGPT